MTFSTLRLILGDQLNHEHSWYNTKDSSVCYVFFEMRQETDYAPHHIQKVVGFFAAMRNFAKWLGEQGHQVLYFQLDDPKNQQDLEKNIVQLVDQYNVQLFEYQLPDEYRLDQQLEQIGAKLSIDSKAYDTEHFLSERHELAEFFKGKKQYLMESFYRSMRKRYKLLMEPDGKPLTGRWNYDAENRKKLPKTHTPPDPFTFSQDLSDIETMVRKASVKTIGQVDAANFIWPTSRSASLELLDFFVEECLPLFGSYQDAMTPHYWSLYHSRLSFSINTKQLSPMEVVQKAIQQWEEHPDKISIAQLEGFIRQIIGWREYMRGVYWAHMPDYAQLNYFNHERKLPDFFWSGDTHMHCVRHAVQQSLQYAYAHHIQRLMVTGNFALLAGIHPDELDEWYLGIYIDAIQWVEITNTRGMSQFADGGIVGTKPYVSSANYIDKMSHYCKDCYYDKKVKTGPRACPFNSLYWHFYQRNRDLLERNPRIGMAYRTWDKMANEKQTALLDQAEAYLENLENL
ncbi:MAG: cryptochrome/photolyase family protein [Bacteroidota bacterium]